MDNIDIAKSTIAYTFGLALIALVAFGGAL